MEKLRIGLFVDSFYPMVDGVVQVVDQYAKRLCEFCDVTVFTTKPRKNKVDTIEHPYKVVRCKIMPVPGQDYDLSLPFFDKAFKKELKKADLDIVHIHSPFTIGGQGVKYAKKHKIPVIATMHSQFKQDFYKATKIKWLASIMTSVIMKTFNKCDGCYAVNSRIAEIYYNDYKVKDYPGILLNGTDFLPVEDENKAVELVNKIYNLDNDIPVLLFVGRLTNLKNVFFIARSLKLLKERGEQFKMLFVGNGPDEQKLKSFIKEYGLSDNVIFTGRITDRELLKAIYSRAKLFLFPSYYDANSLVQIESASQKTPTIFLEGSATSANISNDVDGFIAPNDEKAFTDKIQAVLSDTQLYQTVQNNAFNNLYRSWDDCVKTAHQLYLDHIKKKQEENSK